MSIKRIFNIILLISLVNNCLLGSELKFKSFTLEDGLSGSTVTCFHKSNDNLIWIGSDKGIDLFTGNNFIPLQQFFLDSLNTSNISITDIVELGENTIWAGSWGDGLFSINIETGQYQHYWAANELSNTTISDNYINCLKVFDQSLWVGSNYCLSQTSGNEFIHYNFKEILTKGNPDIRAIVPKYEHLLSIFTNSGEVIELNSQTGTYQKAAELNGSIKNITRVIKDKNNHYWIGTEYNGLFLLDENYQYIELPKQLAIELRSSHISDAVYHDFGVFVSSDGGGLYIINPDDYSFSHIQQTAGSSNSITSNQLESLFIDDEGLLWVGYFKNGFSKANYVGDGIQHIYKTGNQNDLIPNKNVNCFTQDHKSKVWIGTENGISILDNKLAQTELSAFEKKVIKRLSTFPITSLSSNIDNNIIYAGTYNQGLYRINLLTKKITNFNKENSKLESNFIRWVKSENDSLLYIATVDGGMYKSNGKQLEKVKVFYQNDYQLQDFFHLQPIDDESIWLSSAGKGVLRINTSTGSGEMFESVIKTICYSTCITSDSSTYIATNKGIFEYTANENRFTSINNDLKEIDFYGIIEVNKDKLWVSSSAGLYIYNRSSKHFEKVNSNNIQGSEYLPGAFIKLGNNQLLFGGTNGFNVISPEDYKYNQQTVGVFISDFKIYNTCIKPGQKYNDQLYLKKHINHTNQLLIPSDINLFSIRVNTINYLFEYSNKVAYTINTDGVESEIFYADGEIAFLNLQPGKYVLNIYPVDANNNQAILSTSKQISILKKAPWWRSFWLYIGLFTIIMLTVLAIHQLRIRELRKTKETLQKKVTERTATLLSQKERLQHQKSELEQILAKNEKLESFKENIISMIVHDLKNPLNGIIGLSSLNEAEYLENINNASRQMLCLVENILDVRRYETHSLKLFYQQCDIRQLVNEAIDEVRFLLKDNKIEILNLTTPTQVKLDKDVIRRVYINLLTNAIKYSKVNGKITLKSVVSDEQKEKTLLLSVQDEGHGIPQEYQESIFDLYQQVKTKKSGQANSNGLGLSFCKVAIDEHHGKIWVESEKNKGATFYFQIPIQEPMK